MSLQLLKFTTQEMIGIKYVLDAIDENCLLSIRTYKERYAGRK